VTTSIDIDGSRGEGGGQILRTSLALAMCTGRSFTLTKIRAGRAKPGLMRQHLTCVLAAQQVGAAVVDGAEPGSQALRFEPTAVRAGDYDFAVGSAGSCTLVLQTVWPALMLADAPSRLRLAGGTHNPMAPSFHFLERSFAPLVRRLGAGAELRLCRLGFHPAGGGAIDATVQPAAAGLQPFDLLERGPLREAYAEGLGAGTAARRRAPRTAWPRRCADGSRATPRSARIWPTSGRCRSPSQSGNAAARRHSPAPS